MRQLSRTGSKCVNSNNLVNWEKRTKSHNENCGNYDKKIKTSSHGCYGYKMKNINRSILQIHKFFSIRFSPLLASNVITVEMNITETL